jgi:hypothetical protein
VPIIKHLTFLTLALEGEKRSASRSGHCTLGEIASDAHLLGGSLVAIFYQDVSEKMKPLSCSGDRTQVFRTAWS